MVVRGGRRISVVRLPCAPRELASRGGGEARDDRRFSRSTRRARGKGKAAHRRALERRARRGAFGPEVGNRRRARTRGWPIARATSARLAGSDGAATGLPVARQAKLGRVGGGVCGVAQSERDGTHHSRGRARAPRRRARSSLTPSTGIQTHRPTRNPITRRDKSRCMPFASPPTHAPTGSLWRTPRPSVGATSKPLGKCSSSPSKSWKDTARFRL